MSAPLIDAFHEHLEVCPQCADHPFDLCPMGQQLLGAASKSLMKRLSVQLGDKIRKKLAREEER